MKKILAVIICVLLASVMLFACDKDDSSDSSVDTNTETNESSDTGALDTGTSTDTGNTDTNQGTSVDTNTDTNTSTNTSTDTDTNTGTDTDVGSEPSQGENEPERELTETEKALQAAISKTLEQSDYGASMGMTMLIPMGFSSIDMGMDAIILVKGADSDSPEMLSTYTVTVLGDGETVTMYSDGEYVYVDDNEQYKQRLENGYEAGYLLIIRAAVSDIPLEIFAESELVQNENGFSTCAAIPDEKINEMYGEQITSMLQKYVDSISDVKIKNTVMTVYVTDGYVSGVHIDLDADMNVSLGMFSTKVTAKVSTDIEFDEPGTVIEIVPPDGYLDYPEKAE